MTAARRRLGFLLLLAPACGDQGASPDETAELLRQRVATPSAPLCQINVIGKGTKDLETDYLPRVIACEAAASAGIETLKAQAIAARSVAYWEGLGDGSICDGQACQAYTCNRTPGPLHYQAVEATRYQYLAYGGQVTYGFYVNGNPNTSGPACVGSPGGYNENYITYNDGKTGAAVKMTTLGYVPKNLSVFGQNRGCMSQNGSVCLENGGKNFVDILRFYYGADIEIATASGGTCAGAPPAQQVPPPSQQAPQLPDPTPEPPTSSTLQPMTRDEILGIARSGVGYSYWYGGSSWDPNGVSHPGVCNAVCAEPSCHAASPGGPEWGADCSGFVQQVWQAPGPRPVTERIGSSQRYTTHTFRYEERDWLKLASRDELQRGDALVYRGQSGGHIVLFEQWMGNGQALVYECANCQLGCVHRVRSIGAAYVPIRRKLVNDAAEEEDPIGELEEVSCSEFSGWARDPNYPNGSIRVAFTIDKPLEQTDPSLVVVANHRRSELCPEDPECAIGFIVAPPSELMDGLSHRLYAYAFDSGKGQPRLLGGAPRTIQCEPPTTGTCEHSVCQTGAPLDPECSPCAHAICLQRPSCCGVAWDDACLTELALYPGNACAAECAGGPNNCAHSECATGGALPATCSSCAEAVCKRDPYCCEHSWDYLCTLEADGNAYCGCTL